MANDDHPSLAAPVLPGALRELRTRPLFVMQLEVSALQLAGGPEGAQKRNGAIPGGVFTGERLSGTVLGGGGDWQTLRSDGTVSLDARVMLQTGDKHLIAMSYGGLRCGPAEVMARLGRGEAVDPAEYYFRIWSTFSTSAPPYVWMNNIFAVGIGHRLPDGPVYNLFEIA